MERYPGMNFEIIRFTTLDMLNTSDISMQELEGDEG